MTRISETQVVIDRDGDLLLRAEVPLGGLDRSVPQQELDLLEIPARLAAELMGWSAASALIGLGI